MIISEVIKGKFDGVKKYKMYLRMKYGSNSKMIHPKELAINYCSNLNAQNERIKVYYLTNRKVFVNFLTYMIFNKSIYALTKYKNSIIILIYELALFFVKYDCLLECLL